MKLTFLDSGVLIAAEIVTTEKKGKPLHRLTSIKVTTIHPDE
ncbi:MAG TPA: hypothetical protein VIE43_27615 [Thermoanaerobaculia bacterium]|nr:hypothetical protein [Thermoanaerobaculia bacterium]